MLCDILHGTHQREPRYLALTAKMQPPLSHKAAAARRTLRENGDSKCRAQMMLVRKKTGLQQAEMTFYQIGDCLLKMIVNKLGSIAIEVIKPKYPASMRIRFKADSFVSSPRMR